MEFARVLRLRGRGGCQFLKPKLNRADGLVISLVLGIFTGYFLVSIEQEIWNYGVVAA